jgi:hypothetical protein
MTTLNLKHKIKRKPRIPTVSDLDDVNAEIKRQVCYTTIDKLSDDSLLCDYKNSEAVKNNIRQFTGICHEYGIPTSDDFTQAITKAFLIRPGLKGCIRGHKFNLMVKSHIDGLQLESLTTENLPRRFEIAYEKTCQGYETQEIPDWYIHDNLSGKTIVGFNQVDFTSGGQQINKGFKYIKNQNTSDVKIVCVICNDVDVKSVKSKNFILFRHGFEYKTLSYMKNLENIIRDFFPLIPSGGGGPVI